ncbi:hypothetical protein BKN49_05310 [Pseudomonas aeruginosa]|nr:hypothetical protein BKN49_05310 [Pseudomonas aeruginosa]
MLSLTRHCEPRPPLVSLRCFSIQLHYRLRICQCLRCYPSPQMLRLLLGQMQFVQEPVLGMF